ncbi:ACT domain-containing protein [Chakrabartyella piscis]|uniref:ACT domain-containing protein n=1 Tax=Chakrabartyella piscis TaxID=2918914 RepID=UPI002958A62A|nr:ACT domain-containing protein [Chakrabartyella piscis]
MEKAVITVLGNDQVGITAKVCTILAGQNVNILDISQTIVDTYFNMVMVVDIAKANVTFEAMGEELAAAGDAMGLKIKVQHTAIFDAMHRI